MSGSIKRVDARALKAALHDGLEFALLDAREELTFGERHIFMATCLAESDRRTLYVLDVRTPEEYEADHVQGVRSAPGGQLVQETDNYLATWGARVVLADTDGVRAVMTASWLKQMGWNDVSVIRLEDVPGGRMSGPHRPRTLGYGRERVATISPVDLKRRLDAGTVTLVDLEYSKAYRNGTSSAPGSQPAR